MRSRSFLPALSLIALLAACRDETNVGGGPEGGSPSNGGGGNAPSNGGGGNGPSNGGGGEGIGAGPSGGRAPVGGEGGNGGEAPQGGFGGQGGAPIGGEGSGAGGAPPLSENCIDTVDNDGDTFVDCNDVDCAAQAVCGDLVINEIDYDNMGSDANEFAEIYNAGVAPVDLDGLVFYRLNGNSFLPYGNTPLTGALDPDSYLVLASATVVADPGATVITFAAATNSLQNGAPDGVAIYDSNHQVLIDALAYEGALDGVTIDGLLFDLTEGPAATATDLDTAATQSLIRFPNGSDTNNAAVDWVSTTILTPGAENQASATAEDCDNLADDDGDTFVDCADSDCAADPLCIEVCNDSIDNNGNGDIDCEEVACDGQPCDALGSECDTLVCSCPGGVTETICSDGNDNDCDGDIDCADANCAASVACSENCSDGTDNNGNGLSDCLDPLCNAQICGLNGLTCAGTVCACPGGTTEILCGDTLDNDCDGFIDCSDTSCSALPVCNSVLFVNELHYDNTGADMGEGIEVAGTAGLDLTGYTIVLYDAAGATYSPVMTLSGTIPNQMNGFGTLWFPQASIQNGPSDGFALVSPSNTVIQFLSYEGTLTATNGPASGMTSVDIGVSEGTTALGLSLQLTGTYPTLTWAPQAAATPNAINNAQTFP